MAATSRKLQEAAARVAATSREFQDAAARMATTSPRFGEVSARMATTFLGSRKVPARVAAACRKSRNPRTPVAVLKPYVTESTHHMCGVDIERNRIGTPRVRGGCRRALDSLATGAGGYQKSLDRLATRAARSLRIREVLATREAARHPIPSRHARRSCLVFKSGQRYRPAACMASWKPPHRRLASLLRGLAKALPRRKRPPEGHPGRMSRSVPSRMAATPGRRGQPPRPGSCRRCR